MYKIIFLPKILREIKDIYSYFEFNLYTTNAARKFIKKIDEKVEILKYAPKIYVKIKQYDN